MSENILFILWIVPIIIMESLNMTYNYYTGAKTIGELLYPLKTLKNGHLNIIITVFISIPLIGFMTLLLILTSFIIFVIIDMFPKSKLGKWINENIINHKIK